MVPNKIKKILLSLSFCFFFFYCSSSVVFAHQRGESYLQLNVSGRHISGLIDLFLKDLDQVLVLDKDQDGQVSQFEFLTRVESIYAYVQENCLLLINGRGVPFKCVGYQINPQVMGRFIIIFFDSPELAERLQTISVQTNLFFKQTPQHKIRVALSYKEQIFSHILSQLDPMLTLNLEEISPAYVARRFFKKGLLSVWGQKNLFLLLILLVMCSVVCYEKKQWKVAASFSWQMKNGGRIFFGFVLAHSIALYLAPLVHPQMFLSLIYRVNLCAIVFLGLNNIIPFFKGRMGVLSFCSGFYYGFLCFYLYENLDIVSIKNLSHLRFFHLGMEFGLILFLLLFFPLFSFLAQKEYYLSKFFKYLSLSIIVLAFF